VVAFGLSLARSPSFLKIGGSLFSIARYFGTLSIVMRTTYLSAAAFASLLVVSSCSGSTPKAAPTTIASVTSPATTIPTTTAATTTTTVVTPSTTTTIEVATTVDATPDFDAIKQALADYDAAGLACLAVPSTCDPTTYAKGERLESERKYIARIVGLNVHLRRRADDPAYYVLDLIEISGNDATATRCLWDTDVLETGSGVPFNDTNASAFETVSFVRADGRWWVSRVVVNRSVDNENLCGPRP
jgi:hypothetical protein